MKENTIKWHDDLNLDDLVPYTHPSAAWSDRHSNVALCWPDGEAAGLQLLQLMVGWGGNRIVDRLLAWEVFRGGAAVPLTLKSRNFRPDRVVELDCGQGVEIRATACYPARNVIAVEFALANLLNEHASYEVRFSHPGKGVAPDWQGPFPAGRFTSLEGEPDGSWSTLFIHREHGRNVTWVKDFAVGVPEGTTFELVCLADLRDRAFSLPPGAEGRFTVALSFGLNRGRAMAGAFRYKAAAAAGWTPQRETERWMKRFEGAAPLPEKYAGSQQHKRMYAHAIAGLDSLFIQGEGGYTGDKRIPWTTKDLLAIAFFWDTAFSCMGALEFDTGICQEAIECFVDNASPRGGMPGTLCDTHRSGEGQAPVMALAAWRVYRKSGDKEWLGRVYRILGGYSRFWMKYHASPRGFCKFYNAGQIGDNDVRFDPVFGREQGNEPLQGFESPDLSALFVVEMRCLANMAGELGLVEEAAEWAEKSSALGKRIVEAFYFPEESMFFDVQEGTREIFSGAKGPNMFLPLWAGVPLPAEEISRIVERHMLNPDEFYRELPFPSVSYDNPKYDPNGYWRGRIWPHIVYLMIQTLWKHGHRAEAELTADRLLNLFQRTPWFHENYESSGGAGIGATNQGAPIGFPEYNWSQATVIELLLERYKEPFDI